MPRRAPKGEQPRTKNVTGRLTPDQYDSIKREAVDAGMTLSSYAAQKLTGPVVIEQRQTMDAELFAELKRIGNNVNQIAHSMNRGDNPPLRDAVRRFTDLFNLMMRDELTRRRLESIPNDNEKPADDPSRGQVRHQFQGTSALPSE